MLILDHSTLIFILIFYNSVPFTVLIPPTFQNLDLVQIQISQFMTLLYFQCNVLKLIKVGRCMCSCFSKWINYNQDWSSSVYTSTFWPLVEILRYFHFKRYSLGALNTSSISVRGKKKKRYLTAVSLPPSATTCPSSNLSSSRNQRGKTWNTKQHLEFSFSTMVSVSKDWAVFNNIIVYVKADR